MITLIPQKGVLLVAEPSIIGDESFNRSVILLAEHSPTGSVGFILNKKSNHTLNELIPNVNAQFPVFNGGPVEKDNLYFIHKVPDLIPDSIEIANGIYWAGDFNVITDLIDCGSITENDIRFFLGYSGWDPAQLQTELNANAWVVVENKDKNNVIGRSDIMFWKEKMDQLGGDYLIFRNAPSDPSHN